MKFKLHCFPGETWTWDDFVQKTPKGSIALDGMLDEPTRLDFQSLHFNFDHHSGMIRTASMCTAMQIYDQIKVGIIESLRSLEKVNIYVNDCDQDVFLAVWLLRNYHRFEGIRSEPIISRYLWIDEKLDVYAGAYPINLEEGIHRQRKWVQEIYQNARLSGKLSKLSGAEMITIIDASGERLTKLSLGQGEEIPIDIRHEIIESFPGWSLIKEIGGEARYYLYGQGMKAFVSILENHGDRFKYSIGRLSEAIPFPILDYFKKLNRAEGISENDTDRWGGTSIIGGSPRKKGSKLSPKEISIIINS